MNLKSKFYAFSMIALSLIAASCENEEPSTTFPGNSTVAGMFVLNEGTFGAGNSTLSFVDLKNDTLYKDIFGKVNPDVSGNLGDAGNCIAINNGKVYILTSNFVEIIDAATCKHIKRLEMNSPRDIKFYKGNAYVSSYGVMKDIPNYKGVVYEINTDLLEVTKE